MSEGGQGGVSPSPESALAEILHRLTRLEQQIQPYTPLTPLYSLDQACTLLPCRPGSLRILLSKRKHELDAPMYRHDSRHRRYRMLSHQDLLTLRSHLIRRPGYKSRRQALKDLAAA